VVLQAEVLVQPVRNDLAGRVTGAETPLVSEPVSLDDENMPYLPPKGRSKRDQHWTRTRDDVQEAHKHRLPYLRGFMDLFIDPSTGHHFLAQTPIPLSDAQNRCSNPQDLQPGPPHEGRFGVSFSRLSTRIPCAALCVATTYLSDQTCATCGRRSEVVSTSIRS
jgi:hypothetical protein